MSKADVDAVGRPSDEDAVRLTLAFYCILEPDKRRSVMALAEQLAKESQRVDGVTHFTDLDPKSEIKGKSPH
ncbi:MAG: hypothetical protein ABW175_04495 [Bradyrhizobium sp.]